MYTIKWYFSFPYLIHIFRTVHWKLELRAFTVYMYIIIANLLFFSFFFSCTVPQPKDGSLPGEKSWIPACPLDQQLSNFACPCQISVSFFSVVGRTLAWSLPMVQVKIKSHLPGRIIYMYVFSMIWKHFSFAEPWPLVSIFETRCFFTFAPI